MDLFADTYKTIEAPVSAELRERGSKFFAYAFPLKGEQDVKELLLPLKEQFPDATHHCYAWKLDEQQYRVNDDGEPSNTAGRPILRAIQAAGLSKVLVVVVRYFGGKMLGVPGLIQAYRESATLCLAKATILEMEILSHYSLQYPFEAEGEAFRLLKQQQAQIRQQRVTDDGTAQVEFAIRHGRVGQLSEALRGHHKLKMHYLYTE